MTYSRDRFPALRKVAFLGALVLLLVSASGYVWIQGPLNEAITLERQLAKNTGRIMTLDEILTMSARMAAAAHDSKYEARYNDNVGELDTLIKATLGLVSDDQVTKAVSSTDAANLRLVDLETRSFELDKERRYAEALGLLESDAYATDKAAYATGMRTAFARMEAITAARRATVSRWALSLQIAAVFALVIVAGAWVLEQREQQRRAKAYASELEATVAARTAELAQRNRGMRLVLDNVAQGFVTIDLGGVLASERSAVVDLWFGTPAPGATLPEYLRTPAPRFAEWLDMGLADLRDGNMPAEVLIAQLPRRFTSGARTFDVAYTAIGAEDAPEGLLVIISDVTAALAHERAEREQRELVSLFQRISLDRTGVEEFLTEAAALVAELRRENDPIVQKRLVHTLKGNCAIYGMQSCAEFAHAVESALGETGGPMTPEQRDGLVALWKEAMSRVAPLLGGGRRDLVEIERDELETALAQASGGPRELTDTLASWRREPMARRFERLTRQTSSLSRRLGRPEPTVRTTGGSLRLEHEGWQPFWSAMVHAVRNAVDHGIENADERLNAGKPEAGVIELGAVRSNGRLVFTIRDDGRGIDWDRVRAKARERGLAHATHADCVSALFADGLSTRDTVSDLSGRGVGLSALRDAVEAMGGSIEVDSTPGEGTAFRFVFDEVRVRASAAAIAATAPHATGTSLLPFLS